MVLAAVLVVAALILVNAVYVAAEFAAVSARRSRIKQLAEEGNPLASWLVPNLEKPELLDRYIAACQIGITVSGLVLGAYAEASIAGSLSPLLARAGLQPSTAETTSIVIVLLGGTLLAAVEYALRAHLFDEAEQRNLAPLFRGRILIAQALYAFATALSLFFPTWVSIGLIALIQLNYVIAPRIPILRRF